MQDLPGTLAPAEVAGGYASPLTRWNCSGLPPVRPKVPFSSTENGNVTHLGTVTYQKVLYDWKIFLWGYWEAGTPIKQRITCLTD